MLLALLLACFLPNTALAEETGAAEEPAATDTTDIGSDDVTLTEDAVAQPGTAAIVEHEQDGANVQAEPEEFKNDAPAATDTGTETETETGTGTDPVTVENAIQKAIDKALTEIDENTDSITIDVSSGTYDGDIAINGSGVREGVKLYILASDSYEKADDGELIDKGLRWRNFRGRRKGQRQYHRGRHRRRHGGSLSFAR
jgi:hypothetical protein